MKSVSSPRHIISVAEKFGSALDLVNDTNGAPVRIAVNPVEMRVVSDACVRLGIGLRVTATTTPATVEKGSQVIGLGRAHAYGRLYAHLTGRSYEYCEDEGQLIINQETQVLVLFYEDISVALLEYLALLCPNTIGIITGHSEDELRINILTKSLHCFDTQESARLRCDIFPFGPNVSYVNSDYLVASPGMPGPELRALLADEFGIINISSHSDGLDAALTKDVVLCGPLRMLGSDRPALGVGEPGCVSAGHCHRLNIPIDQAITSGNLFDPMEIKAKILIATICHAFVGKRWSFGSEFSLFRPFISNHQIGAVALALSLPEVTPADAPKLADMLCSGLSLGEAIGAFRASLTGRSQRISYCLFGEPRIQVTRVKRKNQKTPPRLPEAVSLTSVKVSNHRSGFFTRFGEVAGATLSPSEKQLIMSAAGDLDSSHVEGRLVSRPTVLQYLTSLLENPDVTTPFKIWKSFSKMGRFKGLVSCPVCSEPARLFENLIAVSPTQIRKTLLCMRCGPLLDFVGAMPSLALKISDDGVVKLEGTDSSRGDYIAGIQRTSIWSNRRVHTISEWPMQEANILSDSFRVAANFPPGRVFCSLLLIGKSGLVALRATSHVQGAERLVP